MLRNKVICCGLYIAVKTVYQADPSYTTQTLIFVIYDNPKVAIFGALTRYIYSDLFFTQVGVAFLNI